MKKDLLQAAMLILIIITIGIAGCVSAPGGQTACSLDAKLCPDGSYVGRDSANNCEFKPCPNESAQIANPASVFCIEGGGLHKVIETPEGQAGYCEFPDGNVCEEWEFFRSNSTTCNPPPA